MYHSFDTLTRRGEIELGQTHQKEDSFRLPVTILLRKHLDKKISHGITVTYLKSSRDRTHSCYSEINHFMERKYSYFVDLVYNVSTKANRVLSRLVS